MSHVVYDTFQYSPMAFIRKELFIADFNTNIIHVIQQIKKLEQHFNINANDRLVKLYASDVYYIIAERNDLLIHMKFDDVYRIRRTFKSLYDEIKSDIIVQINKGIMANIMYVSRIDKDQVMLDNEEVLFMSRNYYKLVKEKFLIYSRGI